MSTTPLRPLRLSRQSVRAAGNAISFLMQQGVENPGCISLAAGLVDEATLPVDLAREGIAHLLATQHTGGRILQYGTTSGPDSIRSAVRSHLARLEQNPALSEKLLLDRIVMTTGSQQLLNLVVQALFEPGDICLVAAPTYFVFLGVLEAVGAEIVPVQTDDHGMVPDDLDRTLQRIAAEGQLPRVKLVYIVSDYENPSGVSVSTNRRPHLLALVKRYSQDHRILLLEDAAYRELRYSGEQRPSIWSFDDDGSTVILAQTFSKSFSPGVRVGFGVLPEDLVKPVCDLKGNDDFGSAHLNQQLLARVLRTGEYSRHVQIIQDSYRIKRDAMLSAAEQHFAGIRDVSWLRPEGGLYVWMTLPPHLETGFNSQLFRHAAKVEKVMYVPGELCHSGPLISRPRNQMRLSFGVQNVDGIHEGMARLARAVRHVGVLD